MSLLTYLSYAVAKLLAHVLCIHYRTYLFSLEADVRGYWWSIDMIAPTGLHLGGCAAAFRFITRGYDNCTTYSLLLCLWSGELETGWLDTDNYWRGFNTTHKPWVIAHTVYGVSLFSQLCITIGLILHTAVKSRADQHAYSNISSVFLYFVYGTTGQRTAVMQLELLRQTGAESK